jgi:hypothetical protein
MSQSDLFKKLARKYCTPEVEKDGSVSAPDGYFAFAVGKSPKSVSQHVYEPVDWRTDLDAVVAEMEDRAASAREDGHAVGYVRAYRRKGSQYAESHRLELSPDDADDDKLGKVDAYAIVHRDQSANLMQLVERYLSREDQHQELVMQLVQVGVQAELRAQVAEARLQESGWAATAAAAREVLPAFAPAANQLAQGLVAYVLSGGRKGAPDIRPHVAAAMRQPDPEPETVRAVLERVRRDVAGVLQAFVTMSPEDQSLTLQAAAELHAGLGAALEMAASMGASTGSAA